jgi:2-dehydro-3-deoxygluconokinase
MMTELLTVGEPMGLFIAQENGALEDVEHYSSRIAGADLNVAIGVARFGHQVAFISQVGDDTFGRQIKRRLEQEKIDSQYLTVSKEWKTGFMLKGLAANGRPATDYYRKGSAAAHISLEKLDQVDFNGVKILHLGGILAGLSEAGYQATLHLIKRAREHQVQITFDPNLRPTIWESEELMIERTNEIAKLCDVVMPNIKEGGILTGEKDVQAMADFYLKQGVKQVIINMVENGSYSKRMDEQHQVHEERMPELKPDQIVDRVGAGDGFVAGVVSGKLERLNDLDCLRRGSAVGAIQMENLGDNEGLPTKAEVTNFLSSKGVI